MVGTPPSRNSIALEFKKDWFDRSSGKKSIIRIEGGLNRGIRFLCLSELHFIGMKFLSFIEVSPIQYFWDFFDHSLFVALCPSKVNAQSFALKPALVPI